MEKIKNRIQIIEFFLEKHKTEVLEETYLLLFAAFFFDAFLHTTMFQLKDHSQLHLMMWIGMLVFVFVKASLSEAMKIREMIMPAITWLFFMVAYGRRSRYEVLITLALLIVGAQGVSFRKIIWVYFVVGIIMMAVMITAAEAGMIENLVYHQPGRKQRIAFGSVYPTDFSAHVFYLCLAWGYLRKDRIKTVELAVFLLCGTGVYVFCEARMNAAGIVLFTVFLAYRKVRLYWAVKRGKIYELSRPIQWLMIISVPLCAGIFTLLTMGYQAESLFWQSLNKLTTSRLSLGKKGITEYGFSWFGQFIPMVGSGGGTEPRPNYFFLDSSYINILLCMGTVVFCIVCVLYVRLSVRAYRQGNVVFLIILLCAALQCTIEHHMLEIAYNPFLLAVFAKIAEPQAEGKMMKGRT